jgi:hypothetical protein
MQRRIGKVTLSSFWDHVQVVQTARLAQAVPFAVLLFLVLGNREITDIRFPHGGRR